MLVSSSATKIIRSSSLLMRRVMPTVAKRRSERYSAKWVRTPPVREKTIVTAARPMRMPLKKAASGPMANMPPTI